MKSRILSLAAIAGMLAATGCSGGGAGSAPSGLTPTTKTPVGGTTTTTTSSNGASFSFSFLMPATALLGTTSTGRHTAYISPGSSGIQVLLSDGVINGTFAVGTQAQPVPISLTSSTTTTTAGAYGTSVDTPATSFPIGTAQLAGATTAQAGPYTAIVLTTLPGSAILTPTATQPFTITTVVGGVTQSVPFVVNSVTGTPASGLFINATETANSTPAAATPFPVGSTMTFGNNAQINGSRYIYSVVPAPAAGPSTLGYYQVTLTFTNMRGGIPYQAGVVLTDIATAGFPILSENQTAILAAIPLFGTNVFPPLTLRPVVNGVFMPPPTPVGVNVSGAPVNSFETTVFLTDARGFVIPNQTAVAVDNAPVFTITSPTNAITIGAFNGYTTTSTQTSNTGVPTTLTYATTGAPNTLTINAGAAAGATNYANIYGTLFSNPQTPSAAQPLTLNVTGAAVTNAAGGVGNPINLLCAAPGQTNGISVSRVTVPPTNATPTVAGYNYVPGTNVPAAAATILALGTANQYPLAGSGSAINCNPSLSLPFN